MIDIVSHTIHQNSTVTDALVQMDKLGQHLTLFVVDDDNRLMGTLTDGDIRRGLIKRLGLLDKVELFMFRSFSYVTKNSFTVQDVASIKEKGVLLLPVLDEDKRIIKIANLSTTQTILPLDVVVMAGGEGRRLRPLTEKTPKPLLKVGDKPIIEHNLDRLIHFGIDDYWICIRYLGEQLQQYFGNGESKNVSINFIWEDQPLGTIGAIRKIKDFKHDYILVTNSDLLTNLDYEGFFVDFMTNGADLSVATIPYSVNIPYAVLDTANGHVVSFKEKPTYTYYSNAGIYLMRKEVLEQIPDGFYNATDLMEKLIQDGRKVISYPIIGYWLDVGNPQDYAKANQDIKHLKF
ncbi:MAG TPA: nucleotidyltransferase family protein [Chryseolinea sp.]|nr:nucleotidyltransferase family protein [Chryseolinea sp.]